MQKEQDIAFNGTVEELEKREKEQYDKMTTMFQHMKQGLAVHQSPTASNFMQVDHRIV